ncbi:MAG: hypothetical protein J6K75_06145, partial [Erysipelotrichaceae bacterium]|nr:hypothetical protein [Erysipelotrichaceae bacterium]
PDSEEYQNFKKKLSQQIAAIAQKYPKEWNEINPASEKPKFGRGIFKSEMKQLKGIDHNADKWLPLRKKYRTWLTKCTIKENPKGFSFSRNQLE